MSGSSRTTEHVPAAVTVFLVDDHELLRRGVREVLEAGGAAVVGESATVADAVPRILALRPDVALVDGRLPDGSGIDVCRAVRAREPSVAVLVLTSYDDEGPLFEAIMAGAAGYLLKQLAGNDLLDAVRRVASGQSLLDPSLTESVLVRLRNGDGPPERPALTLKEEQVLDLVGAGLSNRRIAERLGLAEKTVKNHVSTVLAKLGLESRTQAAILAITGEYAPLSVRRPEARVS